ncbi:UDP-N-acetylmuramoyl-tripeptide--D-alanyl-D-alanine ligase [Myxococcota bacterium]|nr:UDP-N-acetylmuramoyl-tripeptide--D-alanyl-D-alanine ligase [Myxococcota bacterium]MBU1383073.1 UDP-N-acetylmuramoyl-tripeptide--D-alanyl-D-alanine ligase [Myxococcota bacterium]MBU1498246.1 UDP-N-acetylmuramoyl-tripeptide--D-alanyl-D-alanine ligase [Myxococcota bacterium]
MKVSQILDAFGVNGLENLREVHVTGLETDSRRAGQGTVFFALSGQRSDGHHFLDEVRQKGAALCFISDNTFMEKRNDFCVLVDDVIGALGTCAKLKRAEMTETIFAGVTGSCGKTSTKEILAAFLSVFRKTQKTEGNFNNHLGVPLTLGRLEPDTQHAVIEMGMNHPGEIDYLSSISRPQVAIISSIAPVHLEGVGDIQGVRSAKAEIINHMASGSILVCPESESWIIEKAKNSGICVVTFGLGKGDFAVSEVWVGLASTRFTLKWPEGEMYIKLSLAGTHQALNTAAALAAVHSLGLDIKSCKSASERISLPGERNSVSEINGITIFNDSYNSSPSSLKSVMEMINGLEGFNRKILLIGEMLELGEQSGYLHRQAGKDAAAIRPHFVFWVGGFFEEFKTGYGDERLMHLRGENAAKTVSDYLKSGDLLLIKASHGTGLSEVHEKLVRLIKAK